MTTADATPTRDALTEIVGFLKLKVTSLSGRVSTTYPTQIITEPTCALDAVGRGVSRNLGTNRNSFLVRITVIAQTDYTVDGILGEIEHALDNATALELVTCHYAGVTSQGAMRVVTNEDDKPFGYERDLDVKIVTIVKRGV